MAGGGCRASFRRTAVVGALAATAVAGALARSPTAGASASTAAQATPEADAGMAKGSATVLSLAPTTGSLAFELTTGTAVAETAGGLAQALAQTFDLGLIGSALTAEGCDGGDGALAPDQLPQPSQVDNRAGDASSRDTEVSLIPSVVDVGTKEVAATVQPAADASVVVGDVALGPLLRLVGGSGGAQAEVFPGEGRESRAYVEIDVDLAGVIRLDGLRWDARHRTGGQDAAEGAFAVEALEVLGVPVPASDLEGAAAAVNAALAPVGFRIELPRVEHVDEPVSLVRVTPLRLLIVDSPLGAAAVRPALDLTREARAQLFEGLTSMACELADVLLVGELGVGVASGTGALVLELGGVEARSTDIVYEDPFGAVTPAAPAPPAGEPVDVGGPPIEPSSATAPPTVPSAPDPVALDVDVAGAAGVERVCRTTHDAGWPGCSDGAAAAVGAVGAAATVGTALLDLRRRRRMVPVLARTR